MTLQLKRIKKVTNLFKYAGMGTLVDTDIKAVSQAYEDELVKNVYMNIETKIIDDKTQSRPTYYKLDVEKFVELIHVKLNSLQFFIQNKNEYGANVEVNELLSLVNLIDDNGRVYYE